MDSGALDSFYNSLVWEELANNAPTVQLDLEKIRIEDWKGTEIKFELGGNTAITIGNGDGEKAIYDMRIELSDMIQEMRLIVAKEILERLKDE